MHVSSSESADVYAGGLRATLRHRDFAKLWFGQIVSSTGDRFYQFALLHLALGSSAGMLGSFGRDSARVIFCGMIFPVLLSRWIGHQVDRHDRKKLLFWAEAGRGLIALVMLGVWWAGLGLPYLLVLVACSGLLTGLFIPARQSSVPMLVPPEHLVRSNALMTFAGIAAHLAGATAGLAIALIGEAFSFVAAALGFGFSAVMIWLIRTSLLPRHARQKHEASDATGVVSRTAVQMLVWLTVAFTFVTALFLPFVAEHVARQLDCTWLSRWIAKPEDASFAGLIVLLGITGAGLFLGMLIAGQLARLAHWRLLPVLMLAVWGGAIWCLGQTANYLPAALLCFCAGCATGLITIPSDARLQHEVTGGEHGRVFARRLALSNVAFLLGLAMNLDGRLLRVFGSGTLLQYLGIGAIAIAALFRLLAGRTLKGRWGQAAMAEMMPVPAGR